MLPRVSAEATGKQALVVVIDGPAGAGKSTVAKRLAERLELTYLDTGAIYRTLALLARRRGGGTTKRAWPRSPPLSRSRSRDGRSEFSSRVRT